MTSSLDWMLTRDMRRRRLRLADSVALSALAASAGGAASVVVVIGCTDYFGKRADRRLLGEYFLSWTASSRIGHRGVMADPYDLQRFVDAQEPVFDTVVSELRAGRKRSHWMWFVFPQVRGLGVTSMAVRYGIGSGEEAAAYLAHDVLGPRLRRCSSLLARSGAVTVEGLLGAVDAMKLKSSMTLFAEVADDDTDFVTVLDKYYGGLRDGLTLDILTSR